MSRGKKATQDVSVTQKPQQNRFAALSEDSDEEVEEVEVAVAVTTSVAPVTQISDMKSVPSAKPISSVKPSDDGEWTKVLPKKSFVQTETESVSEAESEVEFKKEIEMEAYSPAYASEEEVPPKPVERFPSLLNRGGNALGWAEKIKASLEKAEATRKTNTTFKATEDFVESLGTISFFGSNAKPS